MTLYGLYDTLKEMSLYIDEKFIQNIAWQLRNFKKKSNENDSIFYPQNFKVCTNRVYLSKLGIISISPSFISAIFRLFAKVSVSQM